MSEKNTVEVIIAGKVTKLSGYESEEYLQKVAAYLNHKLGELAELKGFNRMPADTKSLLLSLNVSDDYFKAKNQAEVFEEDLQTKDKELYDLKHEIVNLQMQLDKLKRLQDSHIASSVTSNPSAGKGSSADNSYSGSSAAINAASTNAAAGNSPAGRDSSYTSSDKRDHGRH